MEVSKHCQRTRRTLRMSKGRLSDRQPQYMQIMPSQAMCQVHRGRARAAIATVNRLLDGYRDHLTRQYCAIDAMYTP